MRDETERKTAEREQSVGSSVGTRTKRMMRHKQYTEEDIIVRTECEIENKVCEEAWRPYTGKRQRKPRQSKT